MHVVLTSTSNNNNAATHQWAPCSQLNGITDSNGTLPLPTIYSTRAGGRGKGGRGLRMSNLSATGGVDEDADTVFFGDTIHNG